MYVQGSFAYVCYRALLRKYRAFLFIQRRSFAYVCTGLFCVFMYRLFLRMYVEGSFAEASGSVFFGPFLFRACRSSYLKRVEYKGRGRTGVRKKPFCKFTYLCVCVYACVCESMCLCTWDVVRRAFARSLSVSVYIYTYMYMYI